MTSMILTDETDRTPCRCDNCNWVGAAGEAELEICNVEERLEPGGVVPAGECPECGGLAYPIPVGKMQTASITDCFLVTLRADYEGNQWCSQKAAEIFDSAPEHEFVKAGVSTAETERRILLGEALKEHFELMLDDLPWKSRNQTADCLGRTLLQSALEEVDFYAVADAFLGPLYEEAARSSGEGDCE